MAWFQAWKNVHYIRFRILNHISVPTPKWIKITSSSSVSAERKMGEGFEGVCQQKGDI